MNSVLKIAENICVEHVRQVLILVVLANEVHTLMQVVFKIEQLVIMKKA